MSATIRHSALDKLDLCPCFESNPVSGPAAERGTRMDVAYRGLLMGERQPFLSLSDDEQDAVLWAVTTAKELAEGHEIIADEALLKVTTPHLSHEGTEDSRVNAKSMSMDLKSGQLRSYHKQQAAYALGNMDRTFAKEWECVLLFCDQREVVHYRYTYEEADAWVKGIVESATDPNRQPCANEYCSWCVKKDTCPARTKPIVETLAVVESSQPTAVSLEALKAGLLADPERLGAFLTTNAIFEDFVDDLKIKAKALMLHAHTVVPGWKLQTEAGREHFDRIAIVSAAVTGKSGLDDLVANCGGKMTGTKFREWCAKMGVPVREEQAIVGKDIVKLVADKKKARKAK
jgi:hypothetical protein